MNNKRGQRKKKNAALAVLALLLGGVLVFSVIKLWGAYSEYAKADEFHSELLEYKPVIQTTPAPDVVAIAPAAPTTTAAPALPVENPSVIALKDRYPDVCGWLTIDDTDIDYCFAQAADNERYVKHDLDGGYLVSGTLFLDYMCKSDLSGTNSIIYGHRMKDGTMFAGLEKFAKDVFFEEHTTGTVYLPKNTYALEIFAYLVVPIDDNVVYDPDVDGETFIAYVQKKARQYRDIALKEDDRFLTLSTCNYEFEDARAVLVARLIEP